MSTFMYVEHYVFINLMKKKMHFPLYIQSFCLFLAATFLRLQIQAVVNHKLN